MRYSKSLNGDKIIWLARDKKKVVARADSLEELKKLIEKKWKKTTKKKTLRTTLKNVKKASKSLKKQ